MFGLYIGLGFLYFVLTLSFQRVSVRTKVPARGQLDKRLKHVCTRQCISKYSRNQGQQLDYTSACIACWSLGRFEFALEVGLVVSHTGVDSSPFHVAFEHTRF